ncbi:hypothetical protein BV20DRAFT_128580 [Pilatotrama ljubarskyi]|nr:hypothetical protein BV20DRAFT_128580 [Pilatotrama ljubarskyi]
MRKWRATLKQLITGPFLRSRISYGFDIGLQPIRRILHPDWSWFLAVSITPGLGFSSSCWVCDSGARAAPKFEEYDVRVQPCRVAARSDSIARLPSGNSARTLRASSRCNQVTSEAARESKDE